MSKVVPNSTYKLKETIIISDDTEEYFNADKVSFINKILKTLYNNSQSKPSNAENSEFNKEVRIFK